MDKLPSFTAIITDTPYLIEILSTAHIVSRIFFFVNTKSALIHDEC